MRRERELYIKEKRMKAWKKGENKKRNENDRTSQYISSQPWTSSLNNKELTRSGSLVLVDDSAFVDLEVATA
jgi:hypothetical protein